MRGALVSVALTLAGCASQKACPPIATASPPAVIENTVYVHDYQPPFALIAQYLRVERAEKPLILHAHASVIRGLVPLDAAAVRTMTPILAPDHHATPEELGRAIDAVDAVQAYVSAKQR